MLDLRSGNWWLGCSSAAESRGRGDEAVCVCVCVCVCVDAYPR